MIMNPIEFALILVMAGMLALVVAFGLGWLACDMRAGKQPFDGIQPPPTPPQNRTVAPVSG